VPDITKCTGLGCDKADNCYRVQSESSERQSMFVGLPNNKDGTCDYYWEVTDKKEENEGK